MTDGTPGKKIYSQSGFQKDMFIVSNEKIWLMGKYGYINISVCRTEKFEFMEENKMRVVVIGAAGHIGTYLIPMLVDNGYETIAITRKM